ncbi:MAG: phosphatidate cytidylyltransferase [Chitinophagaceae bacterium]|nr:phosphatidate cytidylyltransferase [Oligoflexus sp.]
MLRTRVITAICALIPFIWVFTKGDLQVIRIFFTVLVGISAFEMAGMTFPALYRRFGVEKAESPEWLRYVTILLSSAIYASLVFADTHVIGYVGLGLLGGLLLGVFAAPTVDLSFAGASGLVTSIVYSVFPWLAVIALYEKAGDARYIFLLCGLVWCGDTGAYFAGRSLGKHKLAPRMSPNKTWEGAVGGIIASVIGGSFLKLYYGESYVAWALIIPCCIFGGIFGQLGDLTESTFKRFSGVKDSGRIFPGHGGFLDRVDGLLFAAPIIWFILYQFGS